MYVGIPVKVLVSSSKIYEISTKAIFLDLLSHDGIISRNAMSHCGSLLTGIITVPCEPFRYQLRGYDSKGNNFTEIKEIKLKPATEVCSSTSTTATTTTPTTPGIIDCPCLNGGRCITYVRYGQTLTTCRCPKGYTGAKCEKSKFIIINIKVKIISYECFTISGLP